MDTSVHFTLPTWEILKFPPENLPKSLPAPVGDGTLRTPFSIPSWLLDSTMHPAVPITFAAIYIFTILNINAYNTKRGNKPWWISQQAPFKLFVVLHNVALALYSLATFLALLRAISVSLPGWNDPTGAAGVADALCKLHGPRGLGDATHFNSTINIWESKNQLIRMLPTGTPDPTDVGRIWNEGLGFWGTLFYWSKFYEVIDTLIIVAKGKRSPTLQTYHHAGAMLSMWAGMRYMSPPIWMFVFVNSFIHALMYTYYTLSALDIRVPESYKRTLTTMQIIQIVWGSTYAAAHLFVSYDIPVKTPYQIARRIADAASSASSAYSSATSAVSSAIASPTISGSVSLFIKKLLLRAAGEEGAAERLGSAAVANQPVVNAVGSKLEEVRERVFHTTYETRWRTDYTRINCIDTSGEAWAITLNLIYLLPLFVLFARFFIRAYISRDAKPRNVKQAVQEIKDDAEIAEAETQQAVEKAGKRAEDAVQNGTAEAKREVKTLHDQLREDVRKLKKGEYTSPKFNERIDKFDKQVKDIVDKAKQQAQQGVDSLKHDDESEEEADDHASNSPVTPDKKKRKHKKKKHSSTPGNVPAEDESAAKQDSNLASSERTRPGMTDSIDTDAMGKSGVGIDLSKSTAGSS